MLRFPKASMGCYHFRGYAMLFVQLVQRYGYNVRNELISADDVSCNYDDIGNHTTDLLGRHTLKNSNQYGYNVRDELISADNVSYAYDDIGVHAPTSVSEVGNRTTAEGKTYTANNLNQYTAIDDFAPQYDDDGIHASTSRSIWGGRRCCRIGGRVS